MSIYIVFLLLLSVPYWGKAKSRTENNAFVSKYFWYVIVSLTLLMGLRGVYVGADTIQYAYTYSISEQILINKKFEQGYSLLNVLCLRLGMDFQVFLLLTSLFMALALLCLFRYYASDQLFSTFIFMTIGLLPMYMSGIRQSLAISICIFSLILSDKKRYIWSLLLILLATTFHVSSVVFFVVPILSRLRLRFSKKQIAIMILIASLAFLYRGLIVSLISILVPQKYINIDITEGYDVNILLIIISILIPAFCVFFNNNVQGDGKYDHKSSLIFTLSCINILFMILAQNSMYFSRIAYYFSNANCVLIPWTVSGQKRFKDRIVMSVSITFLCILYFLISIPGGTLRIDHYIFFWQQ